MGRQSRVALDSMPLIVRARDYHLYDIRGNRYLDFFQNNGKAILGHRVDGFAKIIKNTASRGLIVEYPSIYEKRLIKKVNALLPDYQVVRIYRNIERIKEVFEIDKIADLAIDKIDKKQRVAFWRPFLTTSEVIKADHLIPILPFPGDFVCEIVCSKDDSLAKELPQSDLVSPVLYSVLINAIDKLISLKPEQRELFMQKSIFHPLMKSSDGPYCFTALDGDTYEAFRRAALEAKVVLPPKNTLPIIVPPTFSDGEIKLFVKVVNSFLKGRNS